MNRLIRASYSLLNLITYFTAVKRSTRLDYYQWVQAPQQLGYTTDLTWFIS
ncbi:GTP-binding protein [Microscilla marina ATCC 23134]|uniref:GTP-binding protein n=1 Tax=Microscilla marina ATCC 23134 TaxID=313606 RepID=A1ZSI9_MICM2|nr:GTP-binding protein [Microscilla marina ATCC 23134]